MKQHFVTREMRREHDDKLKRPLRMCDMPKNGIIRATRLALNMTTVQLGARMRVTRNCIIKNELSEIRGEITLSSLRRAGEAMKCRLVYYYVPEEGSLEKTYENRKLFVARGQIEANMSPEKIDRRTLNEMAKKYAAGLKPEEVWDAIADVDELAPMVENSAEAEERVRKEDEREDLRQEREKQRQYGEILAQAKRNLKMARDQNSSLEFDESETETEKKEFNDQLTLAMINAKLVAEHYLKAVEEGRCEPLPEGVAERTFAGIPLHNEELDDKILLLEAQLKDHKEALALAQRQAQEMAQAPTQVQVQALTRALAQAKAALQKQAAGKASVDAGAAIKVAVAETAVNAEDDAKARARNEAQTRAVEKVQAMAEMLARADAEAEARALAEGTPVIYDNAILTGRDLPKGLSETTRIIRPPPEDGGGGKARFASCPVVRPLPRE